MFKPYNDFSFYFSGDCNTIEQTLKGAELLTAEAELNKGTRFRTTSLPYEKQPTIVYFKSEYHTEEHLDGILEANSIARSEFQKGPVAELNVCCSLNPSPEETDFIRA
ncbi:MAG: hypothetical protein E4H06_00630, partial [Methanosarcina sp.]